MHVRNLSLLVVVGLAAVSGCSKGADEPQPGASQGNEVPPATGTVPMNKLTDGQIAQILTTVDEGEIEQAKLAQTKATDPEVRSFANHMIEQHTAAKQTGAQLASQSSLKPADSPKAQELKHASEQVIKDLNAADEKNFDITYMDAQIKQHSEVLTLIKDQLLPAVVEPGLRDHLTQARGMVQQHLDQAKQIKK